MPGRVREPLLVVLSLALLTSCESTTSTLAPTLAAPPQALSATEAVRAFEWAVDHSRPDVLEGLLSADFELLIATADSAGNPTPAAIPRDSVIAAFRALLEGVPGQSEPATASLALDPFLLETLDPRPGRDPRVHRSLRSAFVLNVEDSTGARLQATGHLHFFVSRADSSVVPEGTPTPADTTRWWITRIDDEGVASYDGPLEPNKFFSLWALLGIFLERTWG